MFVWLPWVKAEKQRRADREDRWAAEKAARAAVVTEVSATPFRVRQNPDGTWRAEYAASRYCFSIGFFHFVTWVDIEGCEALATRSLAQAAVRRFIKATEVRLDATGDVVKP